MNGSFAPRPYQTAAIQALAAGWQGPNNRLAVVLPTGAGKTVVFANLILTTQTARSGRTLVIAHREELIQQAADKIRAVAPQLRVGIVKAERDEHHDADVIVASIQTLAVKRRRNAIRDIGMIVVDECHHAAAKTYMTVLEHFGAWRGIPTAGFTATMTRTDGGLSDVWQDVVFTLDILDMIRDGYLVNVRGKRVVVDGLNLDKVKTRAGDLQDSQLAQALEDSGAADVVADAYRQFAADRQGVVFTPTVATAQSMADALNDIGIAATTIWGDMSREARQTALGWYKSGEVQVLTNCMVLTEGFDAPWTSCAVIARPTKSAGLYCQMAGRALRLWDGKKDALLLDVMGASTRHKLASIVDLTGREVPAAEEDQYLTEAVDAAEEAATAALGGVQWEDVDLFHSSPIRWLQTGRGTWFVPLKDDLFLFLVRGSQPGLFRIRRWTAAEGVKAPQQDPDATLDVAMRWTEAHARKLAPPSFFQRTAAWRSAPPSTRQRGWCRYNRLQVPPGATAGDVSDLQAARRVSTLLDNHSALAA
ncbi:DEAD/DEAH box helicase [Streptomyces sp. H27-H1]|uniref:DEAD/DEAH box helicase n=1 Tax=Streptomyces sp. H27-H1 TaxID=2996461 RepID=UPI002271691C|nr:DEAD/DEAH box helicase [Streptomyces sp. H27-H1]MCY0926918.1 DEAD/DEAH box helicase [Streptomyces sp. H27-H1]